MSLNPQTTDAAGPAFPMPVDEADVAALAQQLHHTVMQMVHLAIARAQAARPATSLPASAWPMPATPRPAADPLSAREQEVLQLISDGHSNKVIARQLRLSPHTVKRHVANILDKTGSCSRTQAAAWWRGVA